ncbi:MAG: phage tail tube protein [Patescibacteria group bacterium]
MSLQARGFRGFVVFQPESVYGVKPTTGRALKLPVVSQSLTASQPQNPSNVLTGRRGAVESIFGNIDCSGDIVFGLHKNLLPFIIQMFHSTPITDKTFEIDTNNNKINFKEDTGGGLGAELTATLTSGSYSIADLETEVKTQLEVAGAGTYTVEYNRATRKFTITATGITGFSMLVNSGTLKKYSIFEMLGFSTVADSASVLTITAESSVDKIRITADNNKLDFSEDGGGELTAIITAGDYTYRELAIEIKTQMEAVGTGTYAITYDQDTRFITITQTGKTSLELLWATGSSTDRIIEIDTNNNKINFKEDTGGGLGAELTATLTSGTYTITTFLAEVKTQLEVAGAGTYTASFSATTGKITISATGLTAFDMLFNSGTNKSSSIFDMIGFSTVADSGAVLTVTADSRLDKFRITADNNKLDFGEDGGGELTATITAGDYTFTELALEIKTQLESAGSGTYAVTYSQATRKITITSTGLTSLELKWNTGTNTLITIGHILGFDISADDTLATAYIADFEKDLNTAISIGHILGFDISADDTLATAYIADFEQNLYTYYQFADSLSQESYSFEYNQPDINQFFLYTGIKGSQISFSVGGDQEITMTISLLGKDGTASGSTGFANVDEITDLAQWQNFNSTFKEGGITAKGSMLSFSLDYGLDGSSYEIGDSGSRGDVPEGIYNFSGSLEALFRDRSIIDKADAETISSLEVEFESQHKLNYDDPERFIVLFPAVKYSRNYPSLEGPKGVKTRNDYIAKYDETEGAEIKITFKNSRSHKLF